MAVSITSAPDKLRPAGQPLVFKMEEASTPDRYIVQVYESTLTTTDGTLIGTYYITPDANGDGYFDLSDIAEGRVAAPDTQSAGVIHTVVTAVGTTTQPVMRKYTVKAGQYNAGTATLAEDSDVVYLLGGAMQISQGLHPSFADYYPTGSTVKSWLSDRQLDSSGRRIEMVMAAEDEGIAVLLQTDNLGTATLLDEVEVKLFKNNVNVQTQSNAVVASTIVGANYLIVPLGPANLATLFGGLWDSDWDYYTIRGTDGAGTPAAVTCSIRVDRDCRPIKHDPVQLAWANTVGGWDYLRFDGRNLKTIQTEGKNYRKSLGFSFNSWDRQTTPYHITGKEQYALRNQLFTASERDLLQYAFRSKNVMFRVGTGDWLPCTIDTSSYQVIPAASKTFDVSFTITLAQDIRC
jgi:hypothetical protein